jgi:hypothetical protein
VVNVSQVELFCVDNLMMVEINASEDWIFMDFTFPTKAPGSMAVDEDGNEIILTEEEANLAPNQLSGTSP